MTDLKTVLCQLPPQSPVQTLDFLQASIPQNLKQGTWVSVFAVKGCLPKPGPRAHSVGTMGFPSRLLGGSSSSQPRPKRCIQTSAVLPHYFFSFHTVTSCWSHTKSFPVHNSHKNTEHPDLLLCDCPGGVGNLFSAKGYLDIYTIIPRPYKIINLKITLLYLAKHLANHLYCLGRARLNDFAGLIPPWSRRFPTPEEVCASAAQRQMLVPSMATAPFTSSGPHLSSSEKWGNNDYTCLPGSLG